MSTTNSDESYERTIDYLQQWFTENKNLPKKIDRLLLERFYRCMHRDVEETKKVIEINYAIRNKYTYIFILRDPTDDDSLRTFGYTDMVPLPGLTPENYRITCFRLCDPNPHNMKHTKDTRAFLMITDCRFSMPDITDAGNTSILSEGEVQIFDMTGFSLKHATFLSINTLRIYFKFLQQAFPVRIKAMHMINCPPYIERILSGIRPFLSTEVYSMMHFHLYGIKTLYDHVPKDMLPEEYGGKAGKLADLKKEFMQLMLEKRDYLMDPDYWVIEKSS